MGRTLKQDYNVARLALFNARLLNAIQGSDDQKIRDCIKEVGKGDGWVNTPPLINQSTFMQMSYICLVWLWESVKKENQENAVIQGVFKPGGIQLPNANLGKDARPWSNGEYIRRLRNALSHGNVVITDDQFDFHDVSPYNAQDTCDFSMTWHELGRLCEAVIFSLSALLYPTAAE